MKAHPNLAAYEFARRSITLQQGAKSLPVMIDLTQIGEMLEAAAEVVESDGDARGRAVAELRELMR